MSYGGNHMILPPLGPFSHVGKSSYLNPGLLDVLQARFSNENMYFFTLPFTIFVDSILEEPFNGAIFKLYVLSNTEYVNFLFSVVIPSVLTNLLNL